MAITHLWPCPDGIAGVALCRWSIPHSPGRKGHLFSGGNRESWYIPEEDLVYFEPGQSGTYRAGSDQSGRFIETDQGKFYLGPNDDRAFEKDIENFNRSQRQSQTSSSESEVIVMGQHVIVPVQIKYRGRNLELNLLLDTGASIVTLYKDAVKRLRLVKQNTGHFTTADGHTIAAEIVKLEELKFGPFRKNDILAGVIDHKSNGTATFDGLLGMNALRGLDYKIDYQNSTIRWQAK